MNNTPLENADIDYKAEHIRLMDTVIHQEKIIKALKEALHNATKVIYEEERKRIFYE